MVLSLVLASGCCRGSYRVRLVLLQVSTPCLGHRSVVFWVLIEPYPILVGSKVAPSPHCPSLHSFGVNCCGFGALPPGYASDLLQNGLVPSDFHPPVTVVVSCLLVWWCFERRLNRDSTFFLQLERLCRRLWAGFGSKTWTKREGGRLLVSLALFEAVRVPSWGCLIRLQPWLLLRPSRGC